jgi:hypothetical protein
MAYKNIEDHRANSRKYYAENREKRAEKDQAYRDKNKERISERNRKQYAALPVDVKKARAKASWNRQKEKAELKTSSFLDIKNIANEIYESKKGD